MKSVCLLTPGILPVPATQGGAIETLCELLMRENEIQGLMDLTVVSIAEEQAKERALLYPGSRAVFVNSPLGIGDFVFRARRKFLRLLAAPGSYVEWLDQAVLQRLPRGGFDLAIAEGGSTLRCAFPTLFAKETWYHLHYTPEVPFKCNATRAISVSDYAANEWKQLCEDDIPITTVRNGIDLSRFERMTTEQKCSARAALGFNKNDFVVLYCGRIIPEKGVLELLDAIESLEDESIKLLIVGSADFAPSTSTEYSNRVRAICRRLGNRVSFTGYVDNSEIQRYSLVADVQVVPSIWEEAAGLVCIEAMAAGLPLVVTDSGGIGEYVSTECSIIARRGTGLVRDLAGALVRLKGDPCLRISMSRAGRERSRLFGSDYFYRNFVSAIEASER